MLTDLRFRLRALFRRTVVEAELDDELRFHFERQVEKYLRSGLTGDQARRRARLDFGGYEQLKEQCRDARGTRGLEALWRDVRFGCRILRKDLGFTAVAVVTLSLALGANAAIFSIVDAVLIRPLPYADPHHLVWMYCKRVDQAKAPFSIADFERPAGILRLVIAQGLTLATAGIAGGVLASLFLTRLTARLLYGIGAGDATTLWEAACILLGAALLACYVPARRAASVDPMVTLRHE